MESAIVDYSSLEKTTKNRVIILIALTAAFFNAFFGFNNAQEISMSAATINFFMAVVFLATALLARRFKNEAWPGQLVVMSGSAFFTYIFYAGMADGRANIWGLVVPLGAFFMTGFRSGFVISLIYPFCCMLIAYINLVYPGFSYQYEWPFLVRLTGVYIMSFVMSAGYEYNRQCSEDRLLALLEEAKETKKLISRSEIKYRTLFSGSAHGIFILDRQTRIILEANQAAAEMFGHASEELIGMHECDLRFYPPGEEEESEKQKCHLLNVDEKVKHFACAKQSGNVFYVDLYAVALSVDDRDCIVVFFSDVTHRVRTEQDLANASVKADAASAAKSSFLANMSHEIRTPLNGIIGLNELMLDTELDEEQRELAELMQQSGRTLLALVNDVLDLAKIEAGKLEIIAQPFNLEELFSMFIEPYRIKAELKGLKIRVGKDQMNGLFNGDQLRLRQVLGNLIDNALKFTSVGEINIHCSIRNVGDRKEIFVKVSDTGIGISEEKREQIFNTFVQADTSTTRAYGGSGLGLTICRNLVNMMGGRIGVESVSGKGSTFWFSCQEAYTAKESS